MKTLIAIAFTLAAINISPAAIRNYTYNLSLTAYQKVNGEPAKFSIKTKNILAWAALAEYSGGNYHTNTFPAGTVLVYQYDDVLREGKFIAANKSGGLVCDLSDIMWFTYPGHSIEPSYTSTGYYVERFNYDGTGNGQDLEFFVSGVVAEKISATSFICKGSGYSGWGTFGGGQLLFFGSTTSAAK